MNIGEVAERAGLSAKTIRYYEAQLSLLKVEVHRNHKIGIEALRDIYADAIVIATGVTPRKPAIKGIDHFSVMDYETAIKDKARIKNKVAIIGAGGIGFDVAEMLISKDEDKQSWYAKWNIDTTYQHRGGVMSDSETPEHENTGSMEKIDRMVYLLQRKDEKPGKNLARTTGWIRRLSLRPCSP